MLIDRSFINRIFGLIRHKINSSIVNGTQLIYFEKELVLAYNFNSVSADCDGH